MIRIFKTNQPLKRHIKTHYFLSFLKQLLLGRFELREQGIYFELTFFSLNAVKKKTQTNKQCEECVTKFLENKAGAILLTCYKVNAPLRSFPVCPQRGAVAPY